LYGDPRVPILDEPNSNLDGAGAVALAEALAALKGQVTVVVVTPRKGMLRHALPSRPISVIVTVLMLGKLHLQALIFQQLFL
ncbi:MAG: type secretion system ATPase, partial [Herminiimonas sp.]|nr:type secretion system ATPase [Herminiimonas sp.]